MNYSHPLVSGHLIRRYMRFLADVELDDGQVIKAHCPNPGSMMGLKKPGLKVWLEPNDDPKKKLNWGWRLVEFDDGFVGIDTGAANRIVHDALNAGRICELAGLGPIRPEVKYGQNSRIDFLLGDTTYVEVKSVTLSRQPGLAEFPDSVTARGTKHLAELTDMVAQGHRAVMLFLVQRTDCVQVSVAADIDPVYANALKTAQQKGVEILCYDTEITPEFSHLCKPIPFV
ncbi:DNA/RNA nuclease SfsA [Aestuariibius sp. HNIBRBA575]|uniref:DNA/RNA nuclease SfsA n=1 Tax=Aestuariibius sp. HNIBRBA575 TaxID=3233343 RepID=UPI0034A29FBC